MNPRWTPTDFDRYADMIRRRTGLLFPEKRSDLLRRGVQAAAQLRGQTDLGRFHEALAAAPTNSGLWDDLVGEITIGETYFFRNAGHFNALRETIFPALIKRHLGDRKIRIWCAACSTGEEPYSVAMLARQLIPGLSRWNIQILGTDISKQSLERARSGRYREWSFRRMPSDLRTRYFRREGDHAVLAPEIRDMVTFRYLNQAEDAYPALENNTHAMDLILCRNLSIYLPQDVIQRMSERFHRSLLPEGWLIVGASETNAELWTDFESVTLPGAVIYRKEEWAGPPTIPVPSAPPPRTPRRRSPAPPSVTPPSAPATGPLEEGMRMIAELRHQEAATFFEARMRVAPEDTPTCLLRLARIHARWGDHARATDYCARAVDADPLSPDAQYTRALLCVGEGDVDGAFEALRRTLYLDRNFILGHCALVNLYEQRGKLGDATRHRTRAVRLASKLAPDQPVPGSDSITAERLVAMLQTAAEDRSET